MKKFVKICKDARHRVKRPFRREYVLEFLWLECSEFDQVSWHVFAALHKAKFWKGTGMLYRITMN